MKGDEGEGEEEMGSDEEQYEKVDQDGGADGGVDAGTNDMGLD